MRTFSFNFPKAIKPLENSDIIAEYGPTQHRFLTHEGAINLNDYDLYRIQLVRVDYMSNYSTRRRYKLSPLNISTVLISLEIKKSSDIRLISIFPTTIITRDTNDLHPEFEFTAAVNNEVISLNENNDGKKTLNLNSEYKRRNKKYAVVAYRSSQKAQWAFLLPWLRNKSDYVGDVLCAVPKDLPVENRKILCSYDVHRSGGSSFGVGVCNKEITLLPQ